MQSPTIILCNDPPERQYAREPIRLSYLGGPDERNVKVGLPQFVRKVFHLPERIQDLLEIAAYVYAADRLVSRGRKDAVEYHSWARSFQFHIRVRDIDFWSKREVIATLSRTLEWMSGDHRYEFHFYSGHSTPATNLFDHSLFSISESSSNAAILPFSGGLDSLAGAVSLLATTNKPVILVSHQSQPGVKRTQEVLAEALRERFPERVFHYAFECHLDRISAREETQRTRAFLYSCIAFAIARAYRQGSFSMYENGITSLNFARRQDLMNARASRTTHPQTIGRLQQFLSLVNEAPFTIDLPFLWKTKADVLRELLDGPAPELITSAVSCSHTRQVREDATHCGECFQCIHRRLAAYAVGAEDYDHVGLYANDVMIEAFSSAYARTTCVDFVRQAKEFSEMNPDSFLSSFPSELADIVSWLPNGNGEMDSIERLWKLCAAHGKEVRTGLKRADIQYNDPYKPLPDGSLLQLVNTREHLKPEVMRLVDSILHIVERAIPMMFNRNAPVDEADLNEKIGALLKSHRAEIQSEHPTVSYACVGGHFIIDTNGHEKSSLLART